MTAISKRKDLSGGTPRLHRTNARQLPRVGSLSQRTIQRGFSSISTRSKSSWHFGSRQPTTHYSTKTGCQICRACGDENVLVLGLPSHCARVPQALNPTRITKTAGSTIPCSSHSIRLTPVQSIWFVCSGGIHFPCVALSSSGVPCSVHSNDTLNTDIFKDGKVVTWDECVYMLVSFVSHDVSQLRNDVADTLMMR
jgi:hypothetical protein